MAWAIFGELIYPSDKQIGLPNIRVQQDSRRVLPNEIERWIPARQKINDVEVVDVSDELRNEIRSRDEKHIRESDLHIYFKRRGAIDLRRFVEVLRNIHKDASANEHGIGNANPRVHDDDCDFGEKRIVQPLNVFIDPSELRKDVIENARIRVEHLRDDKKRNELRNGDSRNENRSPNFFELNAFLIDYQSEDHPQKVIRESGEESPNKGPKNDFAKGRQEDHSVGVLAKAKDLGIIIPGHPIEKTLAWIMGAVEIRKANNNHENDGYNGEKRQKDHRNPKHHIVIVASHKIVDEILIRSFFADKFQRILLEGIHDGGIPKNKRQKNQKASEYRI